ncbi:MAG: hypothetical protein UR15_C0008G0004 [Parcubacteria group bacterium GW2011_GWA2_31_28]|nr:MAG: hypothetical protein UR15_C0008G0004 [Parcubacteria group bacterium GW2011_GWA2_31_28]
MQENRWGPGGNIEQARQTKRDRGYIFNRPEPNDEYLSLAMELAQQGYGKGFVIDWVDEEYDSRIYQGTLSAYNSSFQGYRIMNRRKDSEKTIHVTVLERCVTGQ